MKQITAALIGAGQRGMEVYGEYALEFHNEIKFVAVAEPNEIKRNNFKAQHGIADDMCFDSWEELLKEQKLADAIFICTQDKMHYEPVMKSIEKGYHILLEKPMATDAVECYNIGQHAKKYDKVFIVAHVLRYTPFFTKIKELVTSGAIGNLITIQHNENIGYWHFAHSFVRGNWRNTSESSPLILAKTCHDMDLMLWLAGDDCINVSSFGSLSHFKSANAPYGAPMRCTDGCPAEKECPFYAPKQYLTEVTSWPTSVISTDMSMEGRIKALKEGPYGRCVYHCDNDVVDNQVVNMEFNNGVTIGFTVSAFTKENDRMMKLMGTRGELRCFMHSNEIIICDFVKGTKEVIKIEESKYGHGGGDYGIANSFVKMINSDGSNHGLTAASVSVQSHIMAFAAERSRLKKAVVNMDEFIKTLGDEV